MGTLLQVGGGNEVPNVILLQLRSRVRLHCESMLLGAKGSLDQLDDCGDRLPDEFGDRGIVHDWLLRI